MTVTVNESTDSATIRPELTATEMATLKTDAGFIARQDSLSAVYGADSAGWTWHHWNTFTAAWNEQAGRLVIAGQDAVTDQGDWLGVVDLTRRAGWDSEFVSGVADGWDGPFLDRVNEMTLWELSRPA